jgi:hypothetical protein
MPFADRTIVVAPEVVRYEEDFSLPPLKGSSRQIAWGRLIRHEFLGELLPQVMDGTAKLPKEEATGVYVLLGQIRNNPKAKDWIETYKDHRGDALTYLMRTAKSIAAEANQTDAEVAVLLGQEHIAS